MSGKAHDKHATDRQDKTGHAHEGAKKGGAGKANWGVADQQEEAAVQKVVDELRKEGEQMREEEVCVYSYQYLQLLIIASDTIFVT